MSSPVSDRTRSLLARSLPLVQQRRELLIERMERSLAAGIGADAFCQAGFAARRLVDLLLAQVKALVMSGAYDPLDDVVAEHIALGIDGRHYSRFGDALVPILKDLLGPTSPREVAGAWSDTFWAILQAAQPVAQAAE